jgi:hypothetical protein
MKALCTEPWGFYVWNHMPLVKFRLSPYLTTNEVSAPVMERNAHRCNYRRNQTVLAPTDASIFICLSFSEGLQLNYGKNALDTELWGLIFVIATISAHTLFIN